MRIAIIHNLQDFSVKVAKELQRLAQNAGLIIDYCDPEVVITVGGDGTLLSAFHQYNHCLDKIRFVGVHTGHLGFYTDWRTFELNELIHSLKEDTGKSASYPLLELQVNYSDHKQSQRFLALNEAIIRRMQKTMVVDVYIKEDLFERFRGDGLSVSTPTGSTAYNKSVGGAVLNPSIPALQLTEIASLNNRVFRSLGAPLIISNEEWISIQLEAGEDYLLTIDQLTIEGSAIKSIDYKIANERVHFAAYRHMPFWRRVNDAFIGEVTEKDQRSFRF